MKEETSLHPLLKKLSQPLVIILGGIVFMGISSSIVSALDLSITQEQETKSSLDIPHSVKNLSKIEGLWLVDYDKTLEEAKKNPELSAEEIEQMPKIIKRLIETMRIEITENSLIYRRGNRETTILCSFKNMTEIKIIALCNNQNQEATLTFTLIENKYLNFKSSNSDDMDYYIWKRVNDSD
ncbi:MAG: hypothetical protein AB4058_02305 [Microcystaceae cyanobacterium]